MTMTENSVRSRERSVQWERHAISLKERGEHEDKKMKTILHHTVSVPSKILEAKERQ
jgi:hypothetical protein